MKLSHEEKISLLEGLVNHITPDMLWDSEIHLTSEEVSACIFDAARSQIEDMFHIYEDVTIQNPTSAYQKYGKPVEKIRFYSFQVGESIVTMPTKPRDQKEYLKAKETPDSIRIIRTKINEDGILNITKESPSKRDDIFWTFGAALEFVETWMVNRNLEKNTPEAKKLKRGHRL